MYSFLVFASLILVVESASGNVCTISTGEINKPANSQPYYWPSTWNENKTAPALQGSQKCTWNVNVPDGYYAKLIVSGKTGDADSEFQFADSAGRVLITKTEGLQPYYFPPSMFIVYLNVINPATFAFKITWMKLPTKVTKASAISSTPQLINATNNAYYIGYSAVTGVSLVPFPQTTKDFYSLRSSLVFDGENLNTNYAASLFMIYQNELQWISNSQHIYVVNVEASTHRDMLLVQEGGYTRDLHYVELNPVLNSKYTANVDSTEKQTTLLSATYIPQTLTDVQILDSTAVVAIIKGTPTPNNRGTEYTQAELKKILPMSMSAGVVYQFILSSGKAVFSFKA
ncbi:hypothetical protein B9Z55_014445 [Caenorhabditis nigoni]|uniref:Uncharacterized protein n=1 Tax=Caenorhabditis nigoni TaxID=1611254 RepID=A0A2G5U5W5_9PELO|nr:hypothetical protein B9Z55_014445 [Caenorhabditis nigoni]